MGASGKGGALKIFVETVLVVINIMESHRTVDMGTNLWNFLRFDQLEVMARDAANHLDNRYPQIPA